MAIQGTITNLVLYLLKEYNVESIDATQVANIVEGSLNLVPVAAAVVSDSYFGCFPVMIAGTAVSVLVSASMEASSINSYFLLQPPWRGPSIT
jgi:peptide/histidine transporter 3/4